MLKLSKIICTLIPSHFHSAEWKWDGIRVQIILDNFNIKIFSRTGDDITQTFPEIKYFQKELVILDGELLVGRDYIPMTFNTRIKSHWNIISSH